MTPPPQAAKELDRYCDDVQGLEMPLTEDVVTLVGHGDTSIVLGPRKLRQEELEFKTA